MIGLIIVACIILLGVVVVQIGRVTELAAKIRGEEEVMYQNNRRTGVALVVFMVVFLVACVWSALYYKNYMLGYGPHESASAHGGLLDYIFNVTLFFTGIVFILTQIALFWFAYKYHGTKDGRSTFIDHDNKLEVIWTAIPAVVMTFLVVGGLNAWNTVMADMPEDAKAVLIPAEDTNEYLEIEATGYQFAWDLRYPGADGKLGTRDFRKISGTNPLGQDWTDEKNWDDFMPSEIVLPVNRKVRVRITSKDVLHNFYLPHFRVKMDAVPGMPTYFNFTPTKTTEEYRDEIKQYEEYQYPDPDNPDKMKWETFQYELACAELCGKAHFSMRRLVKIVSEDEYRVWLSKQTSMYKSSVRGTKDDPNIGNVLGYEIKDRKAAFDQAVTEALATPDTVGRRIIRLNHVNFETGSANLTANSKYELENLIAVLKQYPSMQIEVAGHTDNVGEDESNQALSESRAQAVYAYLVRNRVPTNRLTAVGYGELQPTESNDTEEGRAQNRRTEFEIIKR